MFGYLLMVFFVIYLHRCSSSYAGTITLNAILGLSLIDGNGCFVFDTGSE